MHVRRPKGGVRAWAGGFGSDRTRPQQPASLARESAYSHSIVPGGLLVMSSTTRLTSRISLIMREAICSSRS